jgi:hypothetical protein
MSFLSILKEIGKVIVGVEPFTPVVSAIPVVGPAASAVINAIYTAEQAIIAPKQGAAKKVVATAIVGASGTTATATAETISQVIDEVVAGLNAVNAALAKLQQGT